MGVWDDLSAARKRVEAAEAELASARSLLQHLEAAAMKGGPDVSSYQGDVDWAKIKAAGYDIVFPKVSDGDVVDPTFTSARVTAIKAAGLSFAPYYYGRIASAGNNERNGRLEAAMAVYFASRQGWGRRGDLPLVYDIETMNGQTVAKAKSHIIDFIESYRGLMGHSPILYTMPSFWASLDPGTALRAAVAGCPLWIAHWEASTPTIPSGWTDWTFWQYTDKATVPGVTGPCDNNRVNITRSALDALRIG